MKIIILITVLTSSFGASALAINCEKIVNREIKKLGLGTADHPAIGVGKKSNLNNSGEPFLHLYRSSQDHEFLQEVAVHYELHKEVITVTSPSINLYGQNDSKEITLNNKCEIESINFCFSGRCSYIEAAICEMIKKRPMPEDGDNVSRFYQTLPNGKGWGKDGVMRTAVENFCEYTYKGLFHVGKDDSSSAPDGVKGNDSEP